MSPFQVTLAETSKDGELDDRSDLLKQIRNGKQLRKVSGASHLAQTAKVQMVANVIKHFLA
jgi:hypothetical protein